MWLLAVVLAFSIYLSLPNPSYDKVAMVIGTAESPNYTISNETELLEFANDDTKWGTATDPVYVLLTDDIPVTSSTWTTIGKGPNEGNYFYGVFDGNGHKITFKNAITITNVSYAWLIGFARDATIKNLCVIWENGLKSTYHQADVGGIIGGGYDVKIDSCYSLGDISTDGAFALIGGIAGSLQTLTGGESSVTNCYHIGTMSAQSDGDSYNCAGGVVGGASSNVTIKNCYHIGKVESKGVGSFTEAYSGGILGVAFSDSDTSIAIDCFSVFESGNGLEATSKGGGTRIGGITAGSWGASANSYYNQTYNTTGSIYRGTGIQDLDLPSKVINEEEFKKIEWSSSTSWSFTDKWEIIGNNYPTLKVFNPGYDVTYDATTNGGTFGSASGYESTVVLGEGEAVDLSTTNRYATKSDGWIFVGWNTDSNAQSALSSLQMPAEAVTLYAIFSKTLTASFYQINTSSAETRDVTIYNTATSGDITNIPAVNSSMSIAGATNITAVGWVKDGSLEDTTGGITISEDVAYYARVNYTITITYNGNGGGVSQASSTGTVTMTANGQATGATPTNAQIPLANNTTPRPNYTFVGWNSNSGGTGTSYTAGESYSFSASTTLYAVWDKTTTTAQLTITLATPSEAGVIIYLVQGNKVAKQFVVMGETKTISVELTKGAEYKIIVSKPYTWQVEYTGNGSVQNDNYVFTASSADVSETQYTITVSGGSIPNNWWIV